MRDCVLTVYGDDAKVLVERRVVIPPLPERTILERLYRENLEGKPIRYAVAREDRVVRALYLAEDLVPKLAHRFGGRKGRVGRWATTVAPCGGVAGRVFVGPELFFRQLDLGSDESWLAPVLMNFAQDVEVESHELSDGKVYQWDLRVERYYYVVRGARWTLWGAGNTQPDRIDAVLAESPPKTCSDLLWTVGAVPIARTRTGRTLAGV